MSFWRQFEILDPISGKAPRYPFDLESIAGRARHLLKARTKRELVDLANHIDSSIEHYFQVIQDDEIHRLEQAGDQYFCEFEADEFGGGTFHFIREKWDELEIVTAKDMGEVAALQECITFWGNDLGLEELSNVDPYEFFAVLSLWLIADAMGWLTYKRHEALKIIESEDDRESIDRVMGQFAMTDDKTSFSLAGKSALQAMEAVCYAEHLHTLQRVEEWHALNVDRITTEQRAKLEAQFEEQKQNETLEHRKTLARTLNEARHKKNREAKNKAVQKWDQDRSAFQSAEKAGLYISTWLKTLDYEYEPRTVTDWIRKYAKTVGVRFR